MEYEQIIPESYPEQLIAKDWSKCKFYYASPAKEFPAMIHNMQVQQDDVWLVTYPKCGTTWMQELLWLLLNDCDFDTALSKDLELRSPFLEFDFNVHRDVQRALKPVLDLAAPRLIKSHLPLALLPAQLWQKKPKVVYVFRNIKDAWVSSYHHNLLFGRTVGSLEEFYNNRIENVAPKQDPIDHAADFYQLRNEPWVYYTSFERMKSNLRIVIEDLCKFLDKSVTEQQMERLLKHLSFEEMKKNPTTNHLWEINEVKSTQGKHEEKAKTAHNFVRRGKVDGYKDELKPEQIAKADKYLNERCQANNVTIEELLLSERH
ncbi:St3, partial [Drosophila busckii]